jgi:hypothetical protein
VHAAGVDPRDDFVACDEHVFDLHFHGGVAERAADLLPESLEHLAIDRRRPEPPALVVGREQLIDDRIVRLVLEFVLVFLDDRLVLIRHVLSSPRERGPGPDRDQGSRRRVTAPRAENRG